MLQHRSQEEEGKQESCTADSVVAYSEPEREAMKKCAMKQADVPMQMESNKGQLMNASRKSQQSDFT